MSAPLLDVDGLAIDLIRHGSVPRRLLTDISFHIQPGEVFALVGESGSGKTMTARAIPGLLPPVMRAAAGSIGFDGADTTTMRPADLRKLRGKEIGMIFQEPMTSLNPSIPVGRQIGEALQLHDGLSAKQAHARALDMLAAVRIADPERTCRAYPHEFSGGMRQRIMIASVLATRPRLLIADEPTTALDALIRREVMELMISLARGSGTAILLISHDLGMVAEYSDRLMVLRNGSPVESGTPQDILLTPRAPYTRTLLDSLPARRAMAAEATAPLVEVNRLSVSFARRGMIFARRPSGVQAVHDASLTVCRGETLAIVGESGSGKTTLGRTILGLIPGAAGTITFDGEPLDLRGCTRNGVFRRRTSMIFQDPGGSLDPRMRLHEIVSEPLTSVESAERRRLAEQALGEVGISAEQAERFPHELSGGQRQRVAIARAIVARPDLIVADEPVSALDPTVQHQVLALLTDLQARHGFASLFISHDLGVVEQVADRVAVMFRGRVLEIASRDAIFDRPGHPYTRRLLQAAPRITRAASGGFELTTIDCARATPPPGFDWFEGQGEPVMIEIAPSHWAACHRAPRLSGG